MIKELVVDIAKALVDNPDEVVVSVSEEKDEIILKLTLAPDDTGKDIVFLRRIAKAFRT